MLEIGDHRCCQKRTHTHTPQKTKSARTTMTTKAFTTTVDLKAINAAGGKYVRAKDDRVIEYSVHGSTRADAHVVVSAYISEHWTHPEPWDEDYQDLNIKHITISLPGLGHSSCHPGYKISEWPKTDLKPVLEAENVDKFIIWGGGGGCLHALAVVQQSPKRVLSLGLRAPYLPLSVSKEKNLPRGQEEFPTTQELKDNTFKAMAFRYSVDTMRIPFVSAEPGSWTAYCMEHGYFGADYKDMARFTRDHPKEMASIQSRFSEGAISTDGILYSMAKDVALDCPGLDIPSIQLSGDHMVVWYGNDDSTCPPSHGKCLADLFEARWTRAFNGHGHLGACLLDMNVFFHRLITSIRIDED
jgi:pimeloyl-ACP methyl ester carboxylesterase